ncbi:proline-specific peptidase [Xylaria arbuscula]|nr:proline-specific peptidase [Xylaria arbuscula]
MAAPVLEGEASFNVPDGRKTGSTWYKVHGNIEDSNLPALVTLHGGSGAGHEHLSPLNDLYSKYGIPIVYYDQVCCGRSTHYRETMGDTSFWTFDLFIRELDNLGGMLSAVYATRNPKGLRKLIIVSSPASVPLYVVENDQLRSKLPKDIRETLEKTDHDTPEYAKASVFFYKNHVCQLDPCPEDVQKISDRIVVDALVLNGRYDEMTNICVKPWFRAIPRVRWVIFEDSSHMAHWEQRDRFIEVCGGFLSY